MRQILFRGKCTDTGRWYEGQYIHLHKTTYCFKEDYDRNPDNDIHQIVFEEMSDWGLPNRHLRAYVNPETVGQYTGLTDKNGKKIFEGDVLCFEDSTGRKYYGAVKYGGWNCDCCDGVYGFITEKGLVDMRDYSSSYIAGNIHDNPELLEAQI